MPTWRSKPFAAVHLAQRQFASDQGGWIVQETPDPEEKALGVVARIASGSGRMTNPSTRPWPYSIAREPERDCFSPESLPVVATRVLPSPSIDRTQRRGRFRVALGFARRLPRPFWRTVRRRRAVSPPAEPRNNFQ